MKINNSYTVTEVAGENIILLQGTYGLETTKVVALNDTALWLWNKFEQPSFQIDDVANALMEKYGIDDILARTDAEAWVNMLEKHGLIES